MAGMGKPLEQLCGGRWGFTDVPLPLMLCLSSRLPCPSATHPQCGGSPCSSSTQPGCPDPLPDALYSHLLELTASWPYSRCRGEGAWQGSAARSLASLRSRRWKHIFNQLNNQQQWGFSSCICLLGTWEMRQCTSSVGQCCAHGAQRMVHYSPPVPPPPTSVTMDHKTSSAAGWLAQPLVCLGTQPQDGCCGQWGQLGARENPSCRDTEKDKTHC